MKKSVPDSEHAWDFLKRTHSILFYYCYVHFMDIYIEHERKRKIEKREKDEWKSSNRAGLFRVLIIRSYSIRIMVFGTRKHEKQNLEKKNRK